jgi:cytochrome c
VGPVLNGLEGHHSGTILEYSYSDANKNSGLTWDEAAFKDYIKDPRAKIPNTKMIFPGIKNEKEAGVSLSQAVRALTATKSRLPQPPST